MSKVLTFVTVFCTALGCSAEKTHDSTVSLKNAPIIPAEFPVQVRTEIQEPLFPVQVQREFQVPLLFDSDMSANISEVKNSEIYPNLISSLPKVGEHRNGKPMKKQPAIINPINQTHNDGYF